MLPPHHLKLVLVEPEIPQNTGNIARLCAATGAALHLVRPLGFFLTDKHFRRAGMDYLANVPITLHDSLPDLLALIRESPVVLSSGVRGIPHWQVPFAPDAWIFLGKESVGLPQPLLDRFPGNTASIPMLAGTRGLNISTAAGILLYEALRQIASLQ
jgi:tRNA (cytidine/uridine-2'-O-)-methyltransferase